MVCFDTNGSVDSVAYVFWGNLIGKTCCGCIMNHAAALLLGA